MLLLFQGTRSSVLLPARLIVKVRVENAEHASGYNVTSSNQTTMFALLVKLTVRHGVPSSSRLFVLSLLSWPSLLSLLCVEPNDGLPDILTGFIV